jgi:arylsulfatase A-like enzyme
MKTLPIQIGRFAVLPLKIIFVLVVLLQHLSTDLFADNRPNILWLTSEDNGPHLGCYGDQYAITPNLDRIASQGLRYNIAWSTVPVCAPARSCLITGMYPCTIGAEHMRSFVKLDPDIKLFPSILRENGYYCTNNNKEDYNFATPDGTWDASSKTAHWRNRKPGQPFFAVFNHNVSHESQIRKRPHSQLHDPAKVRVPAYHPDLPQVRKDWAQYYDKVTEMDVQVGEKLQLLEKAGLNDDTIIFYFSDHGSGMPRSKRSVTNSGLHVPLLIYIPEKFKHLRPEGYAPGASTNRMVAFVDFAPTVLSLANIEPPKYMQGSAFLGKHAGAPKKFLVGMRGRMDERIDLARSVRDERYLYIRNYMPHLPEGQHLDYMFQTPTTRVWKKAFDNGSLNDAQKQFWLPKPGEQLFDLQTDPDQVKNLARSPAHQEVLERMSETLDQWQLEHKDLGLFSEIEIHRLALDDPIYYVDNEGKLNSKRHFLADLNAHRLAQSCAKMVVANGTKEIHPLPDRTGMNNYTSAGDYWIATEGLCRFHRLKNANKDDPVMTPAQVEILSDQLLGESRIDVAIVLAELLANCGDDANQKQAMNRLIEYANLDNNNVYVAVAALNAIDRLDRIAKPFQEQIEALPKSNPKVHSRMDKLVERLLEKTLSDLNRMK